MRMDSEERVPSLFILPLILFFVALILFLALLNRQTDLAVLCFLVIGMAGGAKLWARRSLAGMGCRASVDKARAFPGETVILKTVVKNEKLLPVWLRITASAEGCELPSSLEKVLKKETRLLWYQSVLFEWELTARRRGVHAIGPFRLQAGDLFGFYSSEKSVGEPLSLIVYPKLALLKTFPLPRQDLFGRPGARSPVQDPVYLHGTHDYQPWQPSRYIHWKASARHTRLQSKVFEPSSRERVLLAVQVDQFAERKAEKEFEEILEAAASIAVRLDRQGYAVGFVTNGKVKGGRTGILPVSRNPQQLSMILELLARLEAVAKTDFLDTLRSGSVIHWGMSCVCFVYEEDQRADRIGEYFAYHRTPVKIFACRPRSTREEKEGRGFNKTHLLEEIRIE